MIKVRLAQPGEGTAVTALATQAVPPNPDKPNDQDMAAAIDHLGGRVPVPYGHAHVLVATDGTDILGMCNLTPAIELARAYPQYGPHWQQRLARRIAELDILAVAPGARGQGIAYQLLRAVQSVLAANGSTQLLVQVHQDNTQALAWFARQGFTLPDPDTLILLKFEGVPVGFGSLTLDGYRQGLLSIAGA